jgi:hypothetical protein
VTANHHHHHHHHNIINHTWKKRINNWFIIYLAAQKKKMKKKRTRRSIYYNFLFSRSSSGESDYRSMRANYNYILGLYYSPAVVRGFSSFKKKILSLLLLP